MANYGLVTKGNAKTDDDLSLQLTLLQPTVTQTDTFVTISPGFASKSNGQTVSAYTSPTTPSSYVGGSIDMSTVPGVNVIPNNNYCYALVTLDTTDTVRVFLGSPGSTLLSATLPSVSYVSGFANYEIALVILHKTGSVLDSITNANITDRRTLNFSSTPTALTSAFGYTDQGSGQNCTFGIMGGKTLLTLSMTYMTGANSGTPYGHLAVYDGGVEIHAKL